MYGASAFELSPRPSHLLPFQHLLPFPAPSDGLHDVIPTAAEGSWQGVRKPHGPSPSKFLRSSLPRNLAAILRLRDLTRRTSARKKKSGHSTQDDKRICGVFKAVIPTTALRQSWVKAVIPTGAELSLRSAVEGSWQHPSPSQLTVNNDKLLPIPGSLFAVIPTAVEGSWQGVRISNKPAARSLPRKIFIQIPKLRIHLSDQRQFLLPPPTLDLFFPADGAAYVIVRLKIHQPRHAVLLCETGNPLPLVLSDSSFKVIRDAGVEDTRWAREYVHVINQFLGLCHATTSSVIPTTAAQRFWYKCVIPTGGKLSLRSAAKGSWQHPSPPQLTVTPYPSILVAGVLFSVIPTGAELSLRSVVEGSWQHPSSPQPTVTRRPLLPILGSLFSVIPTAAEGSWQHLSPSQLTVNNDQPPLLTPIISTLTSPPGGPAVSISATKNSQTKAHLKGSQNHESL